MSSFLRISGDFNPDAIREFAPVEFEIRHRIGDTKRGGGIHGDSLIQFLVSDADFGDLKAQFEDMLLFVGCQGDAFAEFCKRPEFSDVFFDFGSEYSPEGGFLFRSFPGEVVAAAASCGAGLEVSLYPQSEGEREER